MTTPGGRPPHLRLVDPGADAADDDGIVDARFDPAFARPAPAGTDADADAEPPAMAPEDIPPPIQARTLVLAAIAFHAVGLLSYLDRYVVLTQSRMIPPAAALFTLPAALALYAGAALLVLRPGRGRGLFLGAAAGLGIAIPIWGVAHDWTWPVALGAIAALAGAWVVRAGPRADRAALTLVPARDDADTIDATDDRRDP